MYRSWVKRISLSPRLWTMLSGLQGHETSVRVELHSLLFGCSQGHWKSLETSDTSLQSRRHKHTRRKHSDQTLRVCLLCYFLLETRIDWQTAEAVLFLFRCLDWSVCPSSGVYVCWMYDQQVKWCVSRPEAAALHQQPLHSFTVNCTCF